MVYPLAIKKKQKQNTVKEEFSLLVLVYQQHHYCELCLIIYHTLFPLHCDNCETRVSVKQDLSKIFKKY